MTITAALALALALARAAQPGALDVWGSMVIGRTIGLWADGPPES